VSDEIVMDDRAWDLLYAANRDVLERAFLDAVSSAAPEDVTASELGEMVVDFLQGAANER
jgi:hypothetical protein